MASVDFFSGYDLYPTSGSEAVLTGGMTPLFDAAANISITATAGQFRTGRAALHCTTFATPYKTGLAARATYYFGSWVFFNALSSTNTILAFSDGSPLTAGNVQVGIGITGAGKIQVFRGRALGSGSGGTQLGSDSTNTLSAATGYHMVVRVTIDNAAGVVEVFINGSKTNWQDQTGLDTQSTANAYANAFGLSGATTGNVTAWDDTWLSDTNLGDIKVVPIWGSTGDGTNGAFTPSTGTDNGAMVDEVGVHDGDSTYNASTTPGNIDTYNAPATGISGTVYSLKLHNVARKTDAGTVGMQPCIRIGGTNYLGTEIFMPTNYHITSQKYDVSPATAAAWGISEIDGAEFGLKHST